MWPIKEIIFNRLCVGTSHALSLPRERTTATQVNLIRIFVNHRLAANLALVLMVLAGIWAISRLNVGLNPVQPHRFADVSITWRGASAEDVEKLVTVPLEQQIKTLPGVETVWSMTRDNASFVEVRAEKGADINDLVDAMKQRIAQIRSFPPEIEPPNVYVFRARDLVAAVLVTGAGSLDELIPLAKEMENELLSRGMDAVEFNGLPTEEIAIQVETRTLLELGLSFDELGRQLAVLSTDAPGGRIGDGEVSRQLRSLDQRRDASAFAELPIHTGAGELVRLGDIATVERRALVDHPYMTVQGQPAIALFVRRDRDTHALEAARNLTSYLDAKAATLPEGVETSLFLEAWRFIQDELTLILGNGLMGLVLVVGALFLFLRLAPAFWVMVGIPATFLAALFGLYYLGASINAISLIGFVMALGIVVDDAIVVGEEAVTQFDAGASPADAATTGAKRMLAPVIASSLTTLCAFTPLVVSDDVPLVEIAIVMLVVISASLVECFLVLPGHLRHAFERVGRRQPRRWRARFTAAFESFRDNRFLPVVRFSMANRGAVVAASLGAFIVVLLVPMNGWIKTEMNLNVDFEEVRADVRFVPGTAEADKTAFMAGLERALLATDAELGGENLINQVTMRNSARINNEFRSGPQYASIRVELTSPERRDVSADGFAVEWLSQVDRSASVDAIAIARVSDWGADFSILLKGSDAATLKRAGDEVIARLVTLAGVSNLRDNLPWGDDQWVLSLTTAGRALGLSTADLGRQLRAAYDGQRIQIFQDRTVELEARLILPERERGDLAAIGQFPIKVPGGEMVPLATVADIEASRGIDVIRHHDGERTLTIRGDVDHAVISGGEVVGYFHEHIRDDVVQKHGVSTGLDELSQAEDQLLSDMLIQFIVALGLIYVVLAWVFASWSWPFAVMAAIPFGITGALLGHIVLGLHINPMSLLGMFALTGIIVNDSIILLSTYHRFLTEGRPPAQAIEDAVRRRFRPVVLTSITTMAGLLPLMFEQAPIAAMFKPLAAAICFGLLYGTLLVLIVIPVLLAMIVSGGERVARWRRSVAGFGSAIGVPTGFQPSPRRANT